MILLSDIVIIKEQTLILKIIVQHDVKNMIMMLPIKSNNISFEGLNIHHHYMFCSYPIRLAVVLVIMSCLVQYVFDLEAYDMVAEDNNI